MTNGTDGYFLPMTRQKHDSKKDGQKVGETEDLAEDAVEGGACRWAQVGHMRQMRRTFHADVCFGSLWLVQVKGRNHQGGYEYRQ